VLHVINGEHFSGAERVQDLLAARLPACGFEVDFVCLKPGKFPEARTYRRAVLHQAPMRSRFDLRVARQVKRLVGEHQYSLIHAHTPRSALVARIAAAMTGVPMIYHVHSPAARDSTSRLHNLLNMWTERLCLSQAAALIAVSDSLRQHMIAQGYRADRVFTVRNGVPVPEAQRNDSSPQHPWTLGMTALFRPRKGLEVLLEALAILQREGVPVQLRGVGPFETADYQRAIHQRVDQLGIGNLVQWTGFTTQVAAELASMDLFVLPSLFGEGLPMVVLEAMAAGVPVVATRVEGVPEALQDGVNGLIAIPNDPADLARCVRSVIKGHVSWSGIRHQALRRHAAEFSDSHMAEGLAKIYRRVVGLWVRGSVGPWV
jgi:glycosyltransferase involved in cell wall biosynthesis